MPQVPVPEVEPLPDGLWERLRADPERAPEALALAAAERFAEPAARWAADRLRHAPPEQAAREAMKKHVRLSALEGAALGLGGAITTVADLVALAWIQARMVFFIAASHGRDPADPMRPAELLVLQDVYPDAEAAHAGLQGYGTGLIAQVVGNRLQGGDSSLTSKLLRMVGRRIARRATARLIPIVASPINAIGNRRETKALGKRALAYYARP